MIKVWLWRGEAAELKELRGADRMERAGRRRQDAQLRSDKAGAVGMRLPQLGDVILASSLYETIDERRYSGMRVLNAGAAAFAEKNVSQLESDWRLAGLQISEKPLENERVYRVCMVDLEPVSLRRINRYGDEAGDELLSAGISAESRHRIGAWPQDTVLRRVMRAAARAVYTAGLDLGEADIAVSGDGIAVVRAVWPQLRDARLEAAALGELAAWHAAGEAAEDRRRILLGADPEFALLTPSGKLASASRFFGAGVGGAAGSDALLVGRRLLYPVAELRPAPAESPAALAANLRRLLARAAGKVREPGLRWVAGAMPVPGLALGGHIHISGAPLSGRLLRLLDRCAAYPLALVEDPAGRRRRPRYGGLGDFRLQQHGGFEYRTLPSWLVSPAAAKAAFALALLCAREAERMPRLPASSDAFRQAYYRGDRETLAGCLDDIAEAIASTPSYGELAMYIEPLFEAARQGKTWDESQDIRTKWRIPVASIRSISEK